MLFIDYSSVNDTSVVFVLLLKSHSYDVEGCMTGVKGYEVEL